MLIGWIGILAGIAAGAVVGLFFHRDGWLGGYASWRRRMVRLGHIAWIGIGLLNIALGLTVRTLPESAGLVWAVGLMAAANVAMPAVCYLSAWRKPFRHLFVVPVACVTSAVVLLLTGGLLP